MNLQEPILRNEHLRARPEETSTPPISSNQTKRRLPPPPDSKSLSENDWGFERGQSSSHRSPISPFIDFPTLMSKLSTLLPPAEMDLIEKYYNEFRQGNITREKLVNRLRLLAGNQMLSDIILDHNAESHQVRLSLLDLEASIEERTPDTSTSSRPASGEHNEGST
ncbi:hypothetical protein Vadar_015599 [Vaccinium darrowii]|uniref:Uncharacterized protein n=1 Tax=Vaccinium darrowii TaxID=229202 RepID=A0ACB7YVJ9_9ERIC|nr:hypothetical protein Vadar_015599 [Vaccinium darrowii]